MVGYVPPVDGVVYIVAWNECVGRWDGGGIR